MLKVLNNEPHHSLASSIINMRCPRCRKGKMWANLAVGLIGAGPNPGNLMYIGVLAVGIIGTILSHFRPSGMERAMYATALALALVVVIALFANMQQYPGSSVIEILGVNGFFITPFVVSGLLFHYAAKQQPPAT